MTRIFGGRVNLGDKNVGKNLQAGRGNNKTTQHPYSGRREAERAAKRLARLRAESGLEEGATDEDVKR